MFITLTSIVYFNNLYKINGATDTIVGTKIGTKLDASNPILLPTTLFQIILSILGFFSRTRKSTVYNVPVTTDPIKINKLCPNSSFLLSLAIRWKVREDKR